MVVWEAKRATKKKKKKLVLQVYRFQQCLWARPVDDQGCFKLPPTELVPVGWCYMQSRPKGARTLDSSSAFLPLHPPPVQQVSALLTRKAVGNTWQAILSAPHNRASLQLTELLGENRASLTTLPPAPSTPLQPLSFPSRLAHAFSFSSRQVVGFH